MRGGPGVVLAHSARLHPAKRPPPAPHALQEEAAVLALGLRAGEATVAMIPQTTAAARRGLYDIS
jgi:hypothetical protein